MGRHVKKQITKIRKIYVDLVENHFLEQVIWDYISKDSKGDSCGKSFTLLPNSVVLLLGT